MGFWHIRYKQSKSVVQRAGKKTRLRRLHHPTQRRGTKQMERGKLEGLEGLDAGVY